MCKMRMAVLVKGWHGSSGTRFSKCCQVEKRQQEREDVFFTPILLSQADTCKEVRWHCCFKQDEGKILHGTWREGEMEGFS